MLISHAWLKELSGLDVAPGEAAERLTAAGLAVEDVRGFGQGLDGVVVAEVRASRPHPARDKLSLVRVFDGEAEHEVVCGAPNVPAPGGRVALAQLGARLPGGLQIAERKLGGVSSSGMLCSESELSIGAGEQGILVLGEDTPAAPGTAIAEALSLHDSVLELDLTPNRPDCLGHVGVARELCAILGERFELPPPRPALRLSTASAALLPQSASRIRLPLGEPSGELPGESGLSPVRVDIEDGARCPRYGAALVCNVRIAPSPFALRYRLHLLGLRPINNVVDATNLILLGFGHPIHAFDYDRLRGSRIQVRLARDGERLHTLDEQARTLTADDLLICDGEGPVALAGVMGGQHSEIGPTTTRVLIECAYFDPRSVRRTAKRTGLHTDSSHRFERGVDRQAVPAVLAAAASLIGELSQGTVVADALDVVAQPYVPARTSLRLSRVERLLGDRYDGGQAERYLRQLGCELEASSDGFEVTLPSHRPDLAREVDLIEELARLRGYDDLPFALPAIVPTEEDTPHEIAFVRRVRELCAAAGLNEALNYAFLSPGELRLARVPERAVRVVNPLSEERSVMRTAVLPGLLQNLQLAQHTQQQSFAQFELARVFKPLSGGQAEGPDQKGLPHEHYELGLLLWGQRESWFNDDEPFDFYDAKGAVEAVVRPLGGALPEARLDAELTRAAAFLHPKRGARLWLGGRPIGVLGELHPDLVAEAELSGRPVFAALDVGELAAATAGCGHKQARPVPRFPASTRDVALVVPEEVAAGEVSRVLAEAGGAICEQVSLFDVYRGAPVPEGRKSLAFRFTYRDPDATLTDKQVDKAHARVLKAAETRFGALR